MHINTTTYFYLHTQTTVYTYQSAFIPLFHYLKKKVKIIMLIYDPLVMLLTHVARLGSHENDQEETVLNTFICCL